MSKHTIALVHLLSAPLCFVALMLLPDRFAAFPVRCSLGLLVWMAWWWVARPVHLAVTAFLPLVVVSFVDVMPIEELLPAYFDKLVVLLLGANMLTTAWTRWGLDRRIALFSLAKFGTRGDFQIAAWFVLAAVLSGVLPNTIVAAALMPIAVAMLRYVGIDDLWNNRFASTLLIAVAWGTSAGGMATPLGGAPNLLVVSALESLSGEEFLFSTWLTRMLPMTVLAFLSVIAYVRLTFSTADANLDRGGEFVRDELRKLGPISRPEWWCLVLLACPLVLSFTRDLYSTKLPNFPPALAFLSFGLLVFIVRHRGEPLLRWEDAQGKMMWGLIFLFAGGSALGRLLDKSGTASFIADHLIHYAGRSDLQAVFVFASITVVLTQITSNTAAVAIIVPIAISTFTALDQNPVPCVYIIAAIANCGFALPSSAGGPAVAAGYGANLRIMFSRGIGAALLVMLLLALCGYLLWQVWPGFGDA